LNFYGSCSIISIFIEKRNRNKFLPFYSIAHFLCLILNWFILKTIVLASKANNIWKFKTMIYYFMLLLIIFNSLLIYWVEWQKEKKKHECSILWLTTNLKFQDFHIFGLNLALNLIIIKSYKQMDEDYDEGIQID